MMPPKRMRSGSITRSRQGAVIMGPSMGESRTGMMICRSRGWRLLFLTRGCKYSAYSFDTEEQMKKYLGNTYVFREGVGKRNLVDGLFTNLTDETILFYREHINFENRQKNKLVAALPKKSLSVWETDLTQSLGR